MSDDDLIHTQAKGLWEKADTEAEDLDVNYSQIYLNYSGPWKNSIADYRKDSKSSLQSINGLYYSAGDSQKRVPGGFE